MARSRTRKSTIKYLNYFTSLTFISLMLTLALSTKSEIIDMLEAKKVEPVDVANIVFTLMGTGVSLLAAYKENSSDTEFVTPPGVPGRSAPDEKEPEGGI